MSAPGSPDDRLNVLEGVAFQGNLLALSVALESAHAGGERSELALVTTELRHLTQAAHDAAQAIQAALPGSGPHADPD